MASGCTGCKNYIKATAGSNVHITFIQNGVASNIISDMRRMDIATEKDETIQDGPSEFSEKVSPHEDRTENIKKGLRELADLQLIEDNTGALQTMVYLLNECVLLEDRDGYVEIRQKFEQLIVKIQSIDATWGLAAEYIKNGKEFEMMLICKAVGTWYKYQAHAGADGVKCIKTIVEECIYSAKNAATKILSEQDIKRKEVYQPYLSTLMHEMLFDLKEIQIKDAEFKVGMETLASYYISCIHYSAEEWQEMFDLSNMAIAELLHECGTEAKKYLSYGDVLFMAAMAKYRMGGLSQAENLWLQAEEVYETRGSSQEKRFTLDWIRIVQREIQRIDVKNL